jgi:tetratricopeptide (TPR) repeat protein
MKGIGRMNARLAVWLALVAVGWLWGCGGSDDNGMGRRGGETVEQRIERSRAYLREYYKTEDVENIGVAEAAALEAVGADSAALALMQLARVRIAQRYYDEAVALLGRVVLQHPYDAEVWGTMGDAFLQGGHYRSADSCYHVMYEVDERFESLRRMALWNERFGDFGEAVAYMDRAIADARQSASSDELSDLYAQLAGMFHARGFVEAALQNVDSSLALWPGVVPRIALRADLLRIKGWTAESDRIYEKLPSLSPHPHYKALLARVCVRRGQHARADSLVSIAADEYRSLSSKYYSVIARRYVEFLLEFDIDRERALSLAYAQSRNRRDIYGYELLAWAYYKNGQYDRAWSSIALGLRRQATDPRVTYRASLIAKAAGKDDRYQVLSERWTQLNPLAAVMYGE